MTSSMLYIDLTMNPGVDMQLNTHLKTVKSPHATATPRPLHALSIRGNKLCYFVLPDVLLLDTDEPDKRTGNRGVYTAYPTGVGPRELKSSNPVQQAAHREPDHPTVTELVAQWRWPIGHAPATNAPGHKQQDGQTKVDPIGPPRMPHQPEGRTDLPLLDAPIVPNPSGIWPPVYGVGDASSTTDSYLPRMLTAHAVRPSSHASMCSASARYTRTTGTYSRRHRGIYLCPKYWAQREGITALAKFLEESGAFTKTGRPRRDPQIPTIEDEPDPNTSDDE
ncbi:Small nuclear ribonucleoprotein Sm D1 [Mycena venus]|uniref:Small nuclear ribonucleoprotein Sm D1 n=1 Tax=Mycena venus TaxID=2733690 RepID=A0A8H6YXW5_9AGAR|nr:Small nuclear ribonucleoprotein Sm D1 [Mycena venus]